MPIVKFKIVKSFNIYIQGIVSLSLPMIDRRTIEKTVRNRANQSDLDLL